MVKSKQLVTEYRKQFGKTYAQMDCISSITNILNRYGGKGDINGSNWYARHEIKNLRPLTNKAQLFDGCAVLKTKQPGESGYALPDRYKNDDIRIDYNHIGIGTDSGQILDSTTVKDSRGNYIRNGPGVSTAPISASGWDVIGEFEDVDYSDRRGAADAPDDFALGLGSTGAEIAQVQNALIQLGYDVGTAGADGQFGKDTLAAVLRFQKDHALPETGLWGSMDALALADVLDNKPEPIDKQAVKAEVFTLFDRILSLIKLL